MGKIDIMGNQYFRDNVRFADLINGVIYQGRQCVHPKELQDAAGELAYLQEDKAVKRVPDGAKWWKGKLVVLYLLEGQSYVDYRMVLRNMMTEAMAYHRQWQEKRLLHERKGDLLGEDEKFSGMKREEKFCPVISLVVYYGADKLWNGARSLSELLDFGEETELIKPFINDYKLNLYDFHDYEDFDNFHTELKTLFEFLRYSKDKNEMRRRMEQDADRYRCMDMDTGKLLANLVNIGELKKYQILEPERSRIDMCKAFEDYKLEGKLEGRAEGELMNIIQLVCKKLAKGKDDRTIAEELEEPEGIMKICRTAREFAPEYSCDEIYEKLHVEAVQDK